MTSMMIVHKAAKVVVVVADLPILAVEYCNHQELIQVAGDRQAPAVLQAVLEVEQQAIIHQWLTDGHLITLTAKIL